MRLASFIRDMPSRVAAGAFILNSGLSKLSADEQTAQWGEGGREGEGGGGVCQQEFFRPLRG